MKRDGLAAIIDIGSNSIRLVVYSGAERMPAPVFNEKLMAGLGTGLAETGSLAPERAERALAALARFRALLDHMEVGDVRVAATAAVRDAANGPEFVRAVEAMGFACRVLSGEEEAELAGAGILSAIPGAEGVVADLGGGSMELVELRGGKTRGGVSLPLGVLRVPPTEAGRRNAIRALADAVRARRLACTGGPLYLVGGSWRALARVDMTVEAFPLPVVHQYEMSPSRARVLWSLVGGDKDRWAGAVSAARRDALPAAAMLLDALVEILEPAKLVVSASGIREGILFSSLSAEVRAQDPLIEEIRYERAGQSPFGPHGELLDRWIGAVFADPPAAARLRLAASILAEIVWHADPAFRADRGIEMALHGNWVGVTAAERVMIAQALSTAFQHDELRDLAIAQLCTPPELERARQWGLAIRLGQRLCGGVSSVLRTVSLQVEGSDIVLVADREQAALVGDAVRRRLRALAEALGAKSATRLR